MYFRVLVYYSVLFWARDSLAVQETLVQEIPYRENLIPGKLFSKPTGLSGDSLIIGTNATELFQDQTTQIKYTCRREAHSVTDEQLGFSTDIKIINRTSGNFELTPGEENNNDRVRPSSDYFIPIRREIWDCNPHMEREGLKIYRIVTELISIKEILQVKYFEGVEVSSVNYLGQGWRTKVKEIRYIGEYDRRRRDYRALKYKGIFILEHLDETKNDVPNLIKHHKMHNDNYEEEVLEIKYREENEQIPIADITSNGKSLKVGATWDKNRAAETVKNYVCERIHGMHPLPHRFQPEVYQKYDNQYYGKISEPYLSKMFTLVRSEVWLCTSNTDPFQFYRVLNEMIGRVEIKDVEYEDSIVALSSINIGSGGEETVTAIRFTEIGIFQVHNHNRLREELQYRLIPSNPKTSFIVPANSGASTSTSTPNIKDMTYILNGNSVYRTLINNEGYDIRVGSAAVTDIGSSSDTSSCSRHSRVSEGFNTVFKLIINDEVSFYTRELIKPDHAHRYYSKKESTVWLCSIQGSQTGEQFYRIVNKIDVVVPVRIIESFDGIDILETATDDGSTTMIKITELKYIKKSRKNAVRYEGKISFLNSEVTSNVVDPYAVTKSIEETTIRVGLPLPLKHDRYFNLRDFGGEMLNNIEEMTFDSTKENTIEFAVTTSMIGGNEDIVDCRLLVDHGLNLYPDFEIYNNQNNEIDSMRNFEDAEIYAKYMERDSYKIWLCENPEENYKFYRTLSHQHVKSQPNHPLGKIRYTKHDKVLVEMEAQYVLKMEAIRYLDGIKYDRVAVKFGGIISFVETIPSKSWKSGSQGVELFSAGDPRKRMKVEPSRKFNYNLERERKIYILPRNSDGIQQNKILEIGTKWQLIHPEKGIVRCTKMESPTGKPEFYTHIWVSGYPTYDSDDLLKEFFTSHLINAWQCGEGENKFFRVVNQFKAEPEKMNSIDKIVYQDGVTLIKTKDSASFDFEIQEVKYRYVKGPDVLKFLGKLEFAEGDGAITPISIPEEGESLLALNQPSSLQLAELYKSNIGQGGIIVEIQRTCVTLFYPVICGGELDGRARRKLKLEEDERYLPNIVIVTKDGDSFKRKLLNNRREIEEYFEFEQQFKNCETSSKVEYYRVENKLTLKTGKQLNTVYHGDGVTVNVEDQGHFTIKDTRYFLKAAEACAVVLGWNPLETSSQSSATGSTNTLRDINYVPEVVNSKVCLPPDDVNSVKLDDILEVGTRITGTIKDAGPVVCKSENSIEHPDSWTTTVFKKLTIQADNNPSWDDLDKDSVRAYFDLLMHEVWECKNNKMETVFFRVVNTFMTLKKLYLFYYDGVKTKIESLPDGETKLLHITEETFYESRDHELSNKYVGEFKLVTEVDRVVNRLFPTNTQGRPAAPRTPGAPPRPDRSQTQSWSMASMAVYAYAKTNALDETDTPTGKDIEQYSVRKFNTTFVGDGHRILQIGTPWEEELSRTESATLKCFLDTKAFYGLRYLPRVVEFIEDNVYELDEEDFFEMLEVTGQKVYLCTNDVHKIVRVKTTFKPKKPTLAIRHTDSVKLNINGNADDYEYSLGDIMEVIYINAVNSKVVKYDGSFSFPAPANAQAQAQTQAQAQRTGRRAGRVRGFLSRVFSGSCLGGCSQPQD